MDAGKAGAHHVSVKLADIRIPGRLNISSAEWSGQKIHAIIGPNGSGKTTLLNALAGFTPTRQGDLFYDGVKRSMRAPMELAAVRSFVEADHQDPFPYPVEDIIGWGRWHLNHGCPGLMDIEAVRRCAGTIGISDLLSRPVTGLSTGERKKAHLARSLAADVAYHIWDEPFAPLDISSTLKLSAVLKSGAFGDKTFLISLHELPLATHIADEVTVLSRGEIIYQGSPKSESALKAIEISFGVRLKLDQDYYADPV